MATTLDTDPDTSTIAAAWSSTPSGDPTPGYGADDPDRRAKSGALVLFTASCLIAGVAALGALVLGGPEPADVVQPGVTETKLTPTAPTQPTVAPAAPVSVVAPRPAPVRPRYDAPKPVAPAPVAPAPVAPEPIAPEPPAPPLGPSVPPFHDIVVLPPLPPLPPLPQWPPVPQPDPEPPVPPKSGPPIFTAPLPPVPPDPPKPTVKGPTDLIDQ